MRRSFATLGLAGMVAGCSLDSESLDTRPVENIPVVLVQPTPLQPIRTTRKVPVLEYTVQPGDFSIKLLQQELEGSSDFSVPAYGDPRATSDMLRMYGDNKGDVVVSYFFTVPQILETLNGDRSMHSGYWQPDEYPLRAGEKVLIPDFNGDRRIQGIPGTVKGHLTFDCSRGREVKKELKYVP